MGWGACWKRGNEIDTCKTLLHLTDCSGICDMHIESKSCQCLEGNSDLCNSQAMMQGWGGPLGDIRLEPCWPCNTTEYPCNMFLVSSRC
ncbi:hypothetical protein Pmani_026956 [Petrolisthes manimaculis]|uniref:Uncharacterized protein n=1 Tax=Petrolisthes manimaculis TaxID=1843537 RepID=A0AAE1P4V6_9EUCA|nr:hypothetical protein Pmani_026956 [Petrolisthes manimaculis]